MPPDARKVRTDAEIFRSMTPETKLRMAARLRGAAWRLKAAWLRELHPDWTERRIEEAVREIFLYAGT